MLKPKIGYPVLFVLMLMLQSCTMFQKHPSMVSPERRLDWICFEHKQNENQWQEYREDRLIYASWYDQDGNIDSCVSYTKTGRIEQRSEFIYDAVDDTWIGQTFDSTGLLLSRTHTRLDSFGREIYHDCITYTTYRDSFLYENEQFRTISVPVPKSQPDTAVYHTTWIYAGKKLLPERPVTERRMLLSQGWNNTICGIYVFNDTLLIEASRVEPGDKYDPPSDSVRIQFGNGITPDTISFWDPYGNVQQRYTVHHDANGRPIAITEENCPSNGDMCPPITKYFFYDKFGNLIEEREAYNTNAPVCPRNAHTTAEWKYNKLGQQVEFCCYTYPTE